MSELGGRGEGGGSVWHDLGLLVRSACVAAGASTLVLGLVGLLALAAGWGGIAWLTGSAHASNAWMWQAQVPVASMETIWDELSRGLEYVSIPWSSVAGPWLEALRSRPDWLACARAALRGVWAIWVWGLVGGAIGYIVVHDLAGRSRPRLGDGVRHAFRHAPTLGCAPLCSLVGLGVLLLVCVLVGVLFRIPWGVGAWLGGGLAFVSLLVGVPLGLLGLTTLVGWPLMTATVAAEGEDLFEAISRAFGYVRHRLPRLLVLAGVAAAVGALGMLVVGVLYRGVLELSLFGMTLGGGSGVEGGGSEALAFWLALARLVALAWAPGYFWSAAMAIYLILREDVDGTARTELRVWDAR